MKTTSKEKNTTSRSARRRNRRKKQQTLRLTPTCRVENTRLKVDWDKSVPKSIKKEEPLREMTLKERENWDDPDYQEFQTRSDTWQGLGPGKFPGLCFFPSLKKAWKAAQQDKTIWKISYTDKKGFNHRWVRRNKVWTDELNL